MCQRGIDFFFLASPNKHISSYVSVKNVILISFLTRIMYEKVNLVCSHLKFLKGTDMFGL